jgi:CRP/FNR family cyclic AMP-dependent transcriptional regulator
MPRLTSLRSVPLFSGLADEQFASISETLGKRAFGKGIIIFHKDSPGRTLYIIESGKVRTFILSEYGQELTLNIHGPGDALGELALLDGKPRSAGAVTLEPTVTFTWDRDDFQRHLRAYPQLALSLVEMLAARLRYTTTQTQCLTFLEVDGRVAAKLIELAERFGVQRQGLEVEMALTQGEFASWVGTTRESVNKALRSLCDRGLIDISVQTVRILDARGLQRLATL